MGVQRLPDGPVRRIEPRAVEVLHEGVWLPATQDAWVRWPDGQWRASVSFTADYDWGQGKHVMSVPAARVRLPRAG